MAPGIATPVPPVSSRPSAEKHIHLPQPTIIHHSLVPSDFDELRFNAAASSQLKFDHSNSTQNNLDNSLISSPYNDPPHLLDLKTLDTPNRLLAQAFTILKPVREDYANAPYTESLNWQAVFGFLRELSRAEGYRWTKQKFYVVAFRSCLLPDVDSDRLYELDAYSHQEANVSGGLLKYWFGKSNDRRENLATCIWRNREDARRGGTGPWHKQARGAAREMYERIEFTTMKLVIGDDVAEWEFGEWTDEE